MRVSELRLRKEMERRHLTAEELAVWAGVDVDAVKRILYGEPDVKPEVFFQLCEKFNVRPRYLSGDEPDPEMGDLTSEERDLILAIRLREKDLANRLFFNMLHPYKPAW